MRLLVNHQLIARDTMRLLVNHQLIARETMRLLVNHQLIARDTMRLLVNHQLIARETMRLLVNHQLISIGMHPKSISLEQICYKRSQGIAVASLHCLLFPMSKNKDLK